MDTRELARIDLNLLLALQVLLEEKNVSLAAARLHITQPAMSKTLSRLRSVFDDPLFLRSGHGMTATPKAEELGGTLGSILANIHQLVVGRDFDPYSFTGEVTIALSEYVGIALLPPLIQRLHDSAPRLSIRTITRAENQLEQLNLGKLDFAIHIEQASYSDDYLLERLSSNAPVILVREGHPLCKGLVTRQRLASYPLIRLYIPDMDQVEIARSSDAFNAIRNPQQGSLETSHLLTALEVLRSTDYFMAGPATILRNPRAASGIVGLALPEGDHYTVDYMLVAHRRILNSPLHQWFRQQILDTLAPPATGASNTDGFQQ